MIPDNLTALGITDSVPRMRGDDPYFRGERWQWDACSPHARG